MSAFLPPSGGCASIAADLRRLDVGLVKTDVDLAPYSRWRCGGPADLVITPRDRDGVSRTLAYLHERAISWSVIGGGSNVFFDDRGVRAPLIHIGVALSEIAVDNGAIRVEAGAWAPLLALRAMRAGLSGIEHIAGIPGAVGGLVVMNGGSLRRGIGENILDVLVADCDGTLTRLEARDCAFSYRASALQGARRILLEARLQLNPADRAAVRAEMLAILASRRRRFPRDLPNCGSVFVSDPALYASFGAPGAVIEQCALKGARRGDAMISTKHANFIVNRGRARAADILALIAHARAVVFARTGHAMRSEVRFVDQRGTIWEAHAWIESAEAHAMINAPSLSMESL